MPEPIEIIILGCGSGIPLKDRQHPGILLRYSGNYFLFDCGEGTQTRLLENGISPLKINKIFITHWHADHFGGLLPLIETLHMEGRKAPLEIYAPEAERFVSGLLELSYWGIGFEIKPIDIDYEKNKDLIFQNDRFEIYSIRALHSVPAVGYFFKEKDTWHIIPKLAKKYGIEKEELKEIKNKGYILKNNKKILLNKVAKLRYGRKIIYSGDTKVSKNIFSNAKNADLLIHDATFIDGKISEERYHSTVQKVCLNAKKSNVKKLILTHFSRRYKDTKEILKVAKKYFKNVEVAHDNMKIVLR
ncbi:MAG: ribonuclease Z [Candidatus Aenigmatarchaeota archaeon]|nr:ribonuclease Z [Candidatus Aenigmarchaeota archaeon]